MKNLLLLFVSSILIDGQTFGQVYTNKVVGAKNEALKDSLKVTSSTNTL